MAENLPIERELYLTLDEVFKGCTKVYKIVRKRFDEAQQLKEEDIVLNVAVEPGIKTNGKIVLEGEGNQVNADSKPGDVIFTVKDKPHKLFKRVNELDIEYVAYLNFNGYNNKDIELEIPTLEPYDPIYLSFDINSEEQENFEERFSERGLSRIVDNKKQRGCLIIRIENKDPNELSVQTDDRTETIEHPVLAVDLEVTLEEVLNGCAKTVTVKRKKLNLSNGTEIEEEKDFSINIKPGIQSGSKIVIEQEGNQLSDGTFTDLVFVVRDEDHPLFVRDDTEIKYVAKISENSLKKRKKICIPTLDKELLKIQLDDEIEATKEKCFYGKGLPYASDTKMRGCLLVGFRFVSDEEANKDQIKLMENENKFVEKQTNIVQIINEPSNNEIDDVVPETSNKEKIKLSFPSNKEVVWISLEEMLSDCKKTVNIERNVFDEYGNFIDKENLKITIVVKAGSVEGTEITIPKMGNRQIGQKPADIIFTVCQFPHLMFTLNKLDIIFTANVTMDEITCEYVLHIPTLDNDFIQVRLQKGQDSKHITRFSKRGIPRFCDANNRGDLVIHYNIVNQKEKDPPLECILPLSLEEILYGTVKNFKINCKACTSIGQRKTVLKECSIEILPGTKPGEKFTFHRGCDENLGKIAGNIVYIVKYLRHPIFKRKGVHIEYTVTVTQRQLDKKEILNIPTLDGKEMKLNLDNFLKQNSTKRYQGYGLPYSYNKTSRGDLIVFIKIFEEPKDPDIVHPINLTLENILHGCTKNIKINRKFYDTNGVETFEDKIIKINIEPGTDEGKEFRYPNLADEYVGRVPADIVFVVKTEKHLNFIRNDFDIVYSATITQKESTNGVGLKIPTLDGDEISLRVDNNIDTSRSIIYEGKGLPKKDGKRGNLLVIFDIIPNNKKDDDVEHYVPVTLEQVLHGYTKRMKLKRTLIDKNGYENEVTDTIEFKIEPGTEAGHRYTFSRMANQTNDLIPGDVIFIVEDKTHTVFTRKGADLECIIKCRSKLPNENNEITIPTLENDNELLVFDEIYEDGTHLIIGKGLPYSNFPQDRGDILVKFQPVYNENHDQIQIVGDNIVQIDEVQAEEVSNINGNNSNECTNDVESFENCLHPELTNLQESETNSTAGSIDAQQNFSNNLDEQMSRNDLNNNENIEQQIYVYVKLKHVLRGAIIKQKVKKFLNKKGKKTIKIKIEPGVQEGSICNPVEGSEISNNFVFVVRYAPHPIFKREGINILYKKIITKKEAARKDPRTLKIKTLESTKSKKYPIVGEINPDTTIVINEWGLPHPDDPAKRGSLIVSFDIVKNTPTSCL